MAYTTIYKDIIFIEGDNDKAKKICKIKANLSGFGAQLKNLNNVKDNLCFQAKLHKCNCILDFKYGQKSSIFSMDDVKFYGSGVCAILDENEYERIFKLKSNSKE